MCKFVILIDLKIIDIFENKNIVENDFIVLKWIFLEWSFECFMFFYIWKGFIMKDSEYCIEDGKKYVIVDWLIVFEINIWYVKCV